MNRIGVVQGSCEDRGQLSANIASSTVKMLNKLLHHTLEKLFVSKNSQELRGKAHLLRPGYLGFHLRPTKVYDDIKRVVPIFRTVLAFLRLHIRHISSR